MIISTRTKPFHTICHDINCKVNNNRFTRSEERIKAHLYLLIHNRAIDLDERYFSLTYSIEENYRDTFTYGISSGHGKMRR